MKRSTLLWAALLCAAGGVAPVALLSCGDPPPSSDPYSWNGDATTSWGGGPATNSSGALASGSSGGLGAGTSGSSSASPSSSGSGDPSGSSGSSGSPGVSVGPRVLSDGGTSDAYVGYCGSGNCDYHSSTCCLPGDAGSVDAAYCVNGTNYACGMNIVTYHCLGAIDCLGKGNVCCGVYDLTAMTAGTSCQPPPCMNPQFCLSDPECSGGQKCTSQSCQGVSPLYLCGLQSGPPYSCTAN